MKQFKTHMVFFHDEESFSTLCGINDGCSEAFYENVGECVIEFGDVKKTTCKKCLKKYEKMIKQHEAELAELDYNPHAMQKIIAH